MREGRSQVRDRARRARGHRGPGLRGHSGHGCSACGQRLRTERGVEVGNIFKLGTKYSERIDAGYTDDKKERHLFVMGCYGIGISRTLHDYTAALARLTAEVVMAILGCLPF